MKQSLLKNKERNKSRLKNGEYLKKQTNFLSERSRFAYAPLHEYDALARSIEKKGKKVIWLNRGDLAIYFKTPKYFIDAYVKSLKSGKTFYAQPTGINELREAISNRYKRLYGVRFGPEKAIVTQGVSEALNFMNAAMINYGDAALMFKPYYSSYMPFLRFYGGTVYVHDYDESRNWDLDRDKIESMFRKNRGMARKVKYMLITNPNNPTGSVLDRKTLEDVVEFAKDHGIFLISDEIYDEIVYNGAKFTSIAQLAKGIPHMILNGASKVFDAPGIRIGYMVLPEEDKLSNELRKKFTDFCDMRLSANTPAQYAFADAINNRKAHEKALRKMVASIENRVHFATKLLNENEYVHAIEPRGAFYIFPKIDIKQLNLRSSGAFVEKLLKEKGVYLTSGKGFGSEGHARLVSAATKEILADAINKINEFCKAHAR